MARVLIAAAMLIASGLPAPAKTSGDMECTHFLAMNATGQMATVESMRSRMFATQKMPSSHVMVDKVAANCKGHANMMVHEAMMRAMPH